MTSNPVQIVHEDCKRSCFDLAPLQPLRGKSLLITGGTGFVGKWITETVVYLNSEHKFNIKLYLLARDIEAFRSEMSHLVREKYLHFIEQDVRNLQTLPEDVQFIIHAAGTPDSREHVSQPLRTIETFYRGTLAVLEAATRLSDLRRMVHLSSNAVYQFIQAEGKSQPEDITESNSVNATYPQSKRLAETLCAIFRNQQQLPVTVIRPFAFIGPYQSLDKPWALNNFMRDAILGGPIRILGNPNTVRSYLYGSDLAYNLLRTAVLEKPQNIYNFFSASSISLQDLADRIVKIVDRKMEVKVRSSKESYPPSKLSSYGFAGKYEQPIKETIGLDEAIDRTIQWNRLVHYPNTK